MKLKLKILIIHSLKVCDHNGRRYGEKLKTKSQLNQSSRTLGKRVDYERNEK